MDRLGERLVRAGFPILGLRYFNVYGPGETHKSQTASMVRQLAIQLRDRRRVCIFEDGLQRRDFVHIDDVVRVTLLALDAEVVGVLNVGSGTDHSFRELADTVAGAIGIDGYATECLPVPADYQSHTRADLSRVSVELDFAPRVPFATGVRDYARAESRAAPG
jgi:ADP-L-glycero-D-manno-heptose 6-epimerase